MRSFDNSTISARKHRDGLCDAITWTLSTRAVPRRHQCGSLPLISYVSTKSIKYRYSGASAVPDSWGIESRPTTMDTVNYRETPRSMHTEATVT